MVSRDSLKRARKLGSGSSNTGISNRRDKRREALGILTSASSYYFNVNRTSLDHLLLGKSADVDKNVESLEYTAGSQRFQNNRPINLWPRYAKAICPLSRLPLYSSAHSGANHHDERCDHELDFSSFNHRKHIKNVDFLPPGLLTPHH